MDFLQTLSESRLLPSTGAYRRFTGRQVAELVYLHVIALRILRCEAVTEHFAKDYATRSGRFLGFAKWYQNATDLHLLIHALVSEDVTLKMPDASQEFKETLYFDEGELRKWLKNQMGNKPSDAMTRLLFMHLDGQLQIKDSSAKAIRRLVQDWKHTTLRQKQLAMTRLLQIMRVRARTSDLLPHLEMVAEDLNLELDNVNNPETGDVADSHKPEKKASMIGKIAAGIAGALVGYKVIREEEETEEEELSEDDGGGATTSANVAPVVMPISTVRRRNPKKKKK